MTAESARPARTGLAEDFPLDGLFNFTGEELRRAGASEEELGRMKAEDKMDELRDLLREVAEMGGGLGDEALRGVLGRMEADKDLEGAGYETGSRGIPQQYHPGQYYAPPPPVQVDPRTGVSLFVFACFSFPSPRGRFEEARVP